MQIGPSMNANLATILKMDNEKRAINLHQFKTAKKIK